MGPSMSTPSWIKTLSVKVPMYFSVFWLIQFNYVRRVKLKREWGDYWNFYIYLYILWLITIRIYNFYDKNIKQPKNKKVSTIYLYIKIYTKSTHLCIHIHLYIEWINKWMNCKDVSQKFECWLPLRSIVTSNLSTIAVILAYLCFTIFHI